MGDARSVFRARSEGANVFVRFIFGPRPGKPSVDESIFRARVGRTDSEINAPQQQSFRPLVRNENFSGPTCSQGLAHLRPSGPNALLSHIMHVCDRTWGYPSESEFARGERNRGETSRRKIHNAAKEFSGNFKSSVSTLSKIKEAKNATEGGRAGK